MTWIEPYVEYGLLMPHPHGEESFMCYDAEADEYSMTPHPHWATWDTGRELMEGHLESVPGAQLVHRTVTWPEVTA